MNKGTDEINEDEGVEDYMLAGSADVSVAFVSEGYQVRSPKAVGGIALSLHSRQLLTIAKKEKEKEKELEERLELC